MWSENEARVACYQMGMSWEEGSGNTNWNCYLTFYFDIELRTTVSNSLNTYHKAFSCLGVEERLIDCSANDYYDCYYGPYYYATVHCLPGIFYNKLLLLLFIVTPSCKSGSFTEEDKIPRICVFGQWYTLYYNNLRYYPVKQYSAAGCKNYLLKAGLFCKGIAQFSITMYLVFFYSRSS